MRNGQVGDTVWISRTKGWFTDQAEGSGMAWYLITILRTIYILKCMNWLFLECSVYYFSTRVDLELMKLWKVRLWVRQD